MLVAEDDTILGCHIVAPGAGDIIMTVVQCVTNGIKCKELAHLCFAHPSVSEAVKEAARIIVTTHDEKDKDYECELAWICDASGGEFKKVPKDIADEAIAAAKRALDDDDAMDAD